MTAPKTSHHDGKPMHYTVAAIIKRGEEYLLIDRRNKPFGWAGLAGHIDEGEEKKTALRREIKEEGGFIISDCRLVIDAMDDQSVCVYGVRAHHWYLYECEVEGEPLIDVHEAKDWGWFSKERIAKLDLEPAWRRWFTQLGLIDDR